jgi:hypothetical protein
MFKLEDPFERMEKTYSNEKTNIDKIYFDGLKKMRKMIVM